MSTPNTSKSGSTRPTTALRWGSLANDWSVEETECGSVTGTFACVFAVEPVGG